MVLDGGPGSITWCYMVGLDLLHGVRWWVWIYYMVLDGGSGSITWC